MEDVGFIPIGKINMDRRYFFSILGFSLFSKIISKEKEVLLTWKGKYQPSGYVYVPPRKMQLRIENNYEVIVIDNPYGDKR